MLSLKKPLDNKVFNLKVPNILKSSQAAQLFKRKYSEKYIITVMRLRLSIHRNGLPETFITWAIDTTESPTIYQLLEQVNEIVPIESDDEWGLEDYAVELKGTNGVNYECLHFQLVNNVMKEDDEVLRCLHSNEIRKRRFSGRNQITVDGKRLYDGVPWGRPFLRANTSRPSIKIPPKNLSRLTYNSSYEENEDYELLKQKDCLSKKVVIRSNKESECENDDDSETDEDYFPENRHDGSSESELDNISEETTDEYHTITESEGIDDEPKNMNNHQDSMLAEKSLISCPQKFSEQDRSNDGSIKNFDLQAQTRLLHSAFPTSSLAVCKYVLTGTNGDIAEAWEAMSIGFPACRSRSEITRLNSEKVSFQKDKINLKNTVAIYNPNNQNASFSNSEKDMVISKRKNHILEYIDQDNQPSGSLINGNSLSCMAMVAQKFDNSSKKSKTANGSNQLINLTKNSENIDFKSSCIDDKFSESDAFEKKNDWITVPFNSSLGSSMNQAKKRNKSNSNNSHESYNDLSSRDQEPEESSSKIDVENRYLIKDNEPRKAAPQSTVAPGQGKRATQLRNKRKRVNNLMRRQIEKGILPAGISKEDFKAMYYMRNSSATAKKNNPNSEWENLDPKNFNQVNGDDEFQRRRKELLDSLASGGLNVSSDLLRSEKNPATSSVRKIYDSDLDPFIQAPIALSEENLIKNKVGELLEAEAEKVSTAPELPKTAPAIIPKNDQLSSEAEEKKATKTSQRSMLNLDVGRRMVFAAMGFKPPVTKQDKEHIRKKIMNNSRASNYVNETSPKTSNVIDETEDPDAWRDKIIYRAKECVQADIELSEPPFPFIQRWDPQQTNKKRKLNLNSRPQTEEIYENTKRQKNTGYNNSVEESNDFLSDLGNEKKVPNTDVEHPNDQIVLPDDLSSLPNLSEEQIEVGMIIVFKQLEVSAATRWQPLISGYKTASIISAVRGKIQIQLARRDFHTVEKIYNEKGERIYSGFDTIDIDETEDDGWRELHFNELIEPKILRVAEQSVDDSML
ncbi:hypothetical protein HI914_01354 [Erysiphe necator]|nr:hypothetical protein HI914_01354 [Erysiphe necator]